METAGSAARLVVTKSRLFIGSLHVREDYIPDIYGRGIGIRCPASAASVRLDRIDPLVSDTFGNPDTLGRIVKRRTVFDVPAARRPGVHQRQSLHALDVVKE